MKLPRVRQVMTCASCGVLLLAGCGVGDGGILDLPIETGFAFTNFSTRFYAALEIRAHAEDGEGEYMRTALLPPGATQRERFLDALGVACPDTIDLRVTLYRRIDEDIPIGLDEDEAVEPAPIVAGEITDVPACGVQPLETYTIVNWDAPEGMARVKLAQGTPVETAIRAANLFPNPDAAWEVTGVDPDLADMPPPAPAATEALSGRVSTAAGAAIADVGVMLRTRFRVRLDDGSEGNDPDAGFGLPIDVRFTDSNGEFEFRRPPGAYRVEFFSDTLLFRPAIVDVESPQQRVLVVAEPI